VVGRLVLIGGNEFRRESDALDRALLALAGGPGAAVAILPTGATNENPEVVAENGIRHLARLGAAPDKVLVVDDESANDPVLAGALEGFGWLYLAGGDPAYLLDTLRGSRAWQAVQAVHARGGLIAASGAGAMALGEQMWRVDGWAAGLGLAPGLAILPHHATLSRRWAVAEMRAALPKGVTLVGLDDSTAVLLPEGKVLGIGQVTVYGREGLTAYAASEVVPLLARPEPPAPFP
jgi:cyanophycinase